MSTIDDLIEKPQIQFVDELIAKANEYYDNVQPIEQEAVFGDSLGIVRFPFMMPAEFDHLTLLHPSRPNVPHDRALGFSLDGVTRNYPGVIAVLDGEEDDMYRVRNREAVYIWPELYDRMSTEDRHKLRGAVWEMHIWAPQQQHERADRVKEQVNG